MNLLLICNPQAGGGRAAGLFPAIQKELQVRGIGYETLLTERPGQIIDELSRRNVQTFDGVVAAGGDGTVFETVNGLYGNAGKKRLPLGVIPIGTGNAFARELGLAPGDWLRAVEILARGQQRLVDVGLVTTRTDRFYFLNIAGLGFVVDAARSAGRLKRFGNSAYTLGTLWQVLRLKSLAVRLEADGQALEQDLVFAEISNTRYTGTQFLIAPSARMDDGMLDITLLRRLPRWRLLWLFPTIYSGTHVKFREISVIQARRILIVSPCGCALTVDGEFRGETPAEITCLHRDLAIFSP